MKPRSGAGTVRAIYLLSLLGSALCAGCLLDVDPPADEPIGEAPAALDDCSHAFVFSPAPSVCNDAMGSGTELRAGADKVALESCAVVEINTYSSSCEMGPCISFGDWPKGHGDDLHQAAAALECKRICEAPGRACVSLGVAPRSLQNYSWKNASRCWDGAKDAGACGDTPEENPADWIQASPCGTLVGAGCGTAVQHHNVYDCLCEPPGGDAPPDGGPLGGPSTGTASTGCHCQMGATGEGLSGWWVGAIALGISRRRRRARR
ncbi:MAG: hypothetical protein ABI193_09195 [Minicystis sp.]